MFAVIFWGGVGAFFFGPIGALIGVGIGLLALYGESIDRGEPDEIEREDLGDEKKNIFTALFGMAAKIAKADGIVSSEEAEVIKLFMKDLNLSEQDTVMAGEIFSEAKNNDISVYDYAKDFGDIYAHNEEMRVCVYHMLFAVAGSDGDLHPEEDRILRNIIDPMRLDASMYNMLAEEFLGQVNSLEEYYEVLGCSPDATDAQVKKSYREKCIEFHPDKIMSKGLPDSFMKFADEQMKMVTNAYDKIQEERSC